MKAVRAVNMPFPCQDCLKAVFELVRGDDTATQVAHHCPHHDSLIHAQVSTLGNERVISQWIVQGPISQREAVKVIEGLGQATGEPMAQQTAERAH